MATVLSKLKTYVKRMKIETNLGGEPCKFKNYQGIFCERIGWDVFRDEFPEGEEGRKAMDKFVDRVSNYVDEKYPEIIFGAANIVYREKKNMKNLKRFPKYLRKDGCEPTK